jgi:hypothetical protein
MRIRISPVQHKEVRPDLLIPYHVDRETLANASILLIYVRPETNKINYEAAIIKGAAPYADAVYLASLSGNLVNNKAITASHYSIQLQFAIEGKEKLQRYPEMVRQFEEKFGVNFHDADIVGSYDAIVDYRIKRNADELFETMVPDSDFLEIYGQTIKRIGKFFIINYDIPSIITRHHEDTAMFSIALSLKTDKIGFQDIDYYIYENLCKNETTSPLVSKRRQNLPWYKLVRRTYHISRSHIEAMFDLTDYVFKNEKERIGYADTPLGLRLLREGIIGEDLLEERLNQLKENPLVYLDQPDGNLKLVNIITEGKVRRGTSLVQSSLHECCEIIKKINWKKSMPL